MSHDNKFLVKPKVRFSRTSDFEDEEMKNVTDTKSVNNKDGPKIRSIETIKVPIKILDLNEGSNMVSESNSNSLNITKKKSNSSSLVCSNDNIDCLKPSNYTSDVGDKQIDKVLQESNFNNIVACNTDDNTASHLSSSRVLNDKITDKVLQHADNPDTEYLKDNTKINTESGKENRKLLEQFSKLTQSKSTKKLECQKNSVYQKNKHCTLRDNTKKSGSTQRNLKKLTKSCTVLDVPRKEGKTSNLSSKRTTINLMPCYKHARVLTKSKASPVKKSLVRDIIGHKVKAYAEPGVHRNKQIDSNNDCKGNKNIQIRPDVASKEILAQPKYNSIMCTINKLNEIKKEKIVTDIEHLPTAYKHLVNGKISTALNFPLDEIIYKNLMDLSIDEKQLPSRMMRSKDPEPRQRDIVPKLSDFFTPEWSDEYCAPVHIKPRNPEVIENSSAFRISDKICDWKNSMDHS